MRWQSQYLGYDECLLSLLTQQERAALLQGRKVVEIWRRKNEDFCRKCVAEKMYYLEERFYAWVNRSIYNREVLCVCLFVTFLFIYGSRSVFMGIHGSRLVIHSSQSVFMVFHGSRLVFHVSRLVFHGFS